MVLIEMKANDGSRVEVKKNISGSFGVMFFPARGEFSSCGYAGSNYFTVEDAGRVALEYILASVTL